MSIKYIGVNDREVDLFEGQYVVPNGMAYNSYVIIDEKIAVFDSVDKKFGEKWLENLKEALGDRTPDYFIISHMEPDHSAHVDKFLELYPSAQVVASDRAFAMLKNFFGKDFADRCIKVSDGDTISLGERTLTFFTAPMVHWPEVIVTYCDVDKTLFSADAFGKFGALDADEDWACEARRYYFGIVGKYGAQVVALLKKLGSLEIEKICPLHGPVLDKDLSYYINLYNIWSSYGVESEGTAIFYTSVYGNTKKAAELLKAELENLGCKKVVFCDLAREDMAEAVEDAFRYGKIVLATTTYNGDIFPFMSHFIEALIERGYKNRKIGLIENGSWAPLAAKKMRDRFEKSAGLEFAENTVTIRSAVNEQNIEQIKALAKEML